jgi:tetratricopeptide (TPR) repeat protein
MSRMKKLWRRVRELPLRAILVACVVILILCAAFIGISPAARNEAKEYFEAANLRMHPSAERAYAYGDEHFNADDPSAYDIGGAEYFFRIAAQEDPSLPYVYHELARIEFLKGDFSGALAYINIQILNQGDKTPTSYYMRGLIEGFMGDYADSEADYAHYLRFDPIDWAAVNDYSWALLKDGKPGAADAAIERVLKYFPNNAWLLNSDAIALSELGEATSARARIDAASQSVASLTPAQWSSAYPGNDPGIASQGLAAFKTAVMNNMHTIDTGGSVPTVQ